jgi:hypothetical protein
LIKRKGVAALVISCKKKLEVARTYSFGELEVGETFYIPSTVDTKNKDIHIKVDDENAVSIVDGKNRYVKDSFFVVPVDVMIEWSVK